VGSQPSIAPPPALMNITESSASLKTTDKRISEVVEIPNNK
jgi:hypothetical protein